MWAAILTNENKERVYAVDPYFDDDDEQVQGFDSEGIKNLRKSYRDAQKRMKELEGELDQFRSSERQRSVSDVIASRGLNPRVAEIVPDYLSGRDEIQRWLEERADIFGSAQQDESVQQAAPVAPPPNAGRLSAALEAGEPVSGDESQMIAMINAAKSPEELNRILFGSNSGPNV